MNKPLLFGFLRKTVIVSVFLCIVMLIFFSKFSLKSLFWEQDPLNIITSDFIVREKPLLENRLEIDNMINWLLNYTLFLLNQNLPEQTFIAEFINLDILEKNRIKTIPPEIEQEKAAIVKIYYRDYHESKDRKPYIVVENFRLNNTFSDLLALEYLNRDDYRQEQAYFKVASEQKKDELREELNNVLNKNIDSFAYSESHYQSLKSKAPNIAFTREELNALAKFAYLYNEITTTLIPNHLNKTLQKVIISSPIFAYTQYAINEKKDLFKADTNKTKTIAIICFFSFIFLLLHFYRLDLGTLIDIELNKRGLEINFKHKMKIVLSNWRFFIFTAPKAKMEPIVIDACEKYQYYLENKALIRDTKKVWKDISDLLSNGLDDFAFLKYDYDIAIDNNRTKRKPLQTRRQHYFKLLDGLASIRRKIESTQSSKPIRETKTVTPKRIKPVINRRTTAISRIDEYLPANHNLKLEEMSFTQLDNLVSILDRLSKMKKDLVDRFLSQANISGLLDNNNPFMGAIRTDEREIIFQTLGWHPKQIKESEQEIEIFTTLPENTNVFIIAGGKAEAKKEFLCQAMLEIGAKKCTFIQIDDVQRVKSIAQKKSLDDIIIHIESRSSHKISAILNKENTPVINVRTINTEKLKELTLKSFTKKY